MGLGLRKTLHTGVLCGLPPVAAHRRAQKYAVSFEDFRPSMPQRRWIRDKTGRAWRYIWSSAPDKQPTHAAHCRLLRMRRRQFPLLHMQQAASAQSTFACCDTCADMHNLSCHVPMAIDRRAQVETCVKLCAATYGVPSVAPAPNRTSALPPTKKTGQN